MPSEFPPLWSALGQLQLELEGVPPLTDEERVSAWLAEQESETADTFRAMLLLRDSYGRDARAERWMELRAIQSPYDTDHGWLVPGGSEAVWLYAEAENAFVCGLFLASLLCTHSACERVLGGCLLDYEDQLDKQWLRWGLGPLTTAAFNLGLIDVNAQKRSRSAHGGPEGVGALQTAY